MLPSTDVLSPRPSTLPAVNGVPDLSEADYAALLEAVRELEHTSFALHLANLLGRQIGQVGKLVPASVTSIVNRAAESAIRNAFHIALRSLGSQSRGTLNGTRRFHKAAVVFSGAAGGAFGLASLPVELPISTTLILRSIADIARHEGEDLSEPETLLACLQVFALGGREDGGDFTESGYFATRGLFAKSVSEAARYLVGRAVTDEASPVLVRFLAQIGARFGVVVSQKLAVQAVPVLGAAGGAAVNYAFLTHFQRIAHGHFTIRRLERIYGRESIHAEYERLAQSERRSAWSSAPAGA
jgi:EcsC protein family